ncbi:hypothetical protein VWY34_15265 [Phaeobacter sp. JH20_02]|uniref:hypothetical protein n=1 Tax=unclassified Phaeobacter TaxID=2621772 RepID=UPI003A896AAD
MPVTLIRAHADCDGCGVRVQTDLDAADQARSNRSLHSIAADYFAGDPAYSVQGAEKILCGRCTQIVDRFVTEDRNATDDEIKAALA